MTRILFVCTGNICRSPTAEGVTKHILKNNALYSFIEVDSAGTQGYHVGEPPDRRSQLAAQKRGIDLSGLRARQVHPADFKRFDLLLAMDRDHLATLNRDCPPEYRDKLSLFMRYASRFKIDEVPDPYYGGAQGFEAVLDMIEDAASGLIASLRSP